MEFVQNGVAVLTMATRWQHLYVPEEREAWRKGPASFLNTKLQDMMLHRLS